MGVKPLRLVVMDDDPQSRALFSKMLTALGHQAEAVPCDEAHVGLFDGAAMQARGADLLMVDLPPSGDSRRHEILKRLQSPTRARVIVTSSRINDPVLRDHLPHGFCATLLKPFSLEDLTEALAQGTPGSLPPRG